MGHVAAPAALRRDYLEYEEMYRRLQDQFPRVRGEASGGTTPSPGHRPDRSCAKRSQPASAGSRAGQPQRKTGVDPFSYTAHGVVSLDEVRQATIHKITHPDGGREFAGQPDRKAYFDRLYQKLGVGLWEDIQPYKTGFSAREYSHTMPDDVVASRTGTFLDPFIATLYQTGYVPGRARLWLAAYLIHWRRVRWQSGACWILMHLLDGHPPATNLSWQWVASTFSSRPFFFTLDDLHQHGVRLEGFDNAPFEGSRTEIARRLFPKLPAGAVS